MITAQREIRYLTTEELLRFCRHAEDRAIQANETGAITAIRAWALLDMLLSSCLRASKVAGLQGGTSVATPDVTLCVLWKNALSEGGLRPHAVPPQSMPSLAMARAPESR